MEEISSERIISLLSGNAILNSLIRSGYNTHLIDIRDFPIIQLKNKILILHILLYIEQVMKMEVFKVVLNIYIFLILEVI
ncbi:hypothetical protein [Buchnera aphidicola]|uniref:hypothetical protein n=1 Tax=Buchnera aphidicola TaxID=9 RepID=UPI003BEF40B7